MRVRLVDDPRAEVGDDVRVGVGVCVMECNHERRIRGSRSATNENKKHLKNVGPIRHNEPPHAHSPDVASGTVARRLRIDVHDIDNDENDNDNA